MRQKLVNTSFDAQSLSYALHKVMYLLAPLEDSQSTTVLE